MNQLGNGLAGVGHHEDALSVQEADLSTLRRVGASHPHILTVQSNMAHSYHRLGRLDDSLGIRRTIYSDWLRMFGLANREGLRTATNYAACLNALKRFGEAKRLLREVIPVARRVLGDSDDLTLTLRVNYAQTLQKDDGATLDDVREAVTTLEDTERIARRVLGGTHPFTMKFEDELRKARAALRVRGMFWGA